jgi:hypothetical protein
MLKPHGKSDNNKMTGSRFQEEPSVKTRACPPVCTSSCAGHYSGFWARCKLILWQLRAWNGFSMRKLGKESGISLREYEPYSHSSRSTLIRRSPACVNSNRHIPNRACKSPRAAATGGSRRLFRCSAAAQGGSAFGRASRQLSRQLQGQHSRPLEGPGTSQRVEYVVPAGRVLEGWTAAGSGQLSPGRVGSAPARLPGAGALCLRRSGRTWHLNVHRGQLEQLGDHERFEQGPLERMAL